MQIQKLEKQKKTNADIYLMYFVHKIGTEPKFLLVQITDLIIRTCASLKYIFIGDMST